MSNVSQRHAHCFLRSAFIRVGELIKLASEDDDWNHRVVHLVGIFVLSPFSFGSLLHGFESIIVRLLKISQCNLTLFSHCIEPEQETIDNIAWLGKIDHNDDCSVLDTFSNHGGLQKIGEGATPTKLIHIDLDFLVVFVVLDATRVVHGSCLWHLLFDLLFQEFRDHG